MFNNYSDMDLNKKTECLKVFAHLVKIENTGNASAFARKLNISRSTLYTLLEEIKIMGVDIQYNRLKESYYYNSDKMLTICTPVKVSDIHCDLKDCPFNSTIRKNYSGYK